MPDPTLEQLKVSAIAALKALNAADEAYEAAAEAYDKAEDAYEDAYWAALKTQEKTDA